MDRGSRVFWGLVVALGTASTFFGVSAERARRSVQQAAADVETGDLVELASVLDGDTVLVTTRAGGQVTVRIVGVKAFSADAALDDTRTYGREATDVLRGTLQGKPARVLVHAPRKDARGRTLASLYVDDRDVALELIGRGLVLVYTAYPFPGMTAYLEAQGKARTQKVGIWSSPGATARAEGLSREWASEAAR